MDSNTVFCLGSLNIPGPYFHALGEGLCICSLNENSGQIDRLITYQLPGNVIWLKCTGDLLLTATENYLEPGLITAWKASKTGEYARFGMAQSSLGGAICHLTISADLRTVFAASYAGGITVHAFDPKRGLCAAHQQFRYIGSGSNLERQNESHPHHSAIAPDGSYVLVCDLGCDKIWFHLFDGIKLSDPTAIKIESGSGPRHLAFHPKLPRVYLLGELDAKLRVLEKTGNNWNEIAVHPTLADDFKGIPSGAALHIHPNQTTFFVSNRNSDTITIFTIDARGDLSRSLIFYTHGHTPREFSISPSGKWLLVANQDSHQVVSFELDPVTGFPNGNIGQPFACGSPMCLSF